MAEHWDEWLGELALSGVRPYDWTLNEMLAAFESTVRKGCKDEAEWKRRQAELYAEPKEVRDERQRAARAGRPLPDAPQRMSLDSAEAMLARFAASDAALGAS